MSQHVTNHIDCDSPEQAAIVRRILSKNNLAFSEAEHLPLSGQRQARFIVDTKTFELFNELKSHFSPDVGDTIQIAGDKKNKYGWVGSKSK